VVAIFLSGRLSLTPALSRREREKASPPHSKIQPSIGRTLFRNLRNVRTRFPLPAGRVRVRFLRNNSSRFEPLNLAGTARCTVQRRGLAAQRIGKGKRSFLFVPPAIARAGTSQRDVPTNAGFRVRENATDISYRGYDFFEIARNQFSSQERPAARRIPSTSPIGGGGSQAPSPQALQSSLRSASPRQVAGAVQNDPGSGTAPGHGLPGRCNARRF